MQDTIFFDLGNVLLFFDHEKMCRQIAELTRLDINYITQTMASRLDPYERGEITTQNIYRDFCLLADHPIAYDQVRLAISDIFKENLDSVEIVKELKAKGKKLYILSNTCEAHFDYAVQHFPFLQWFDGHILSYRIGARKPEKTIFEKALTLARCNNNQCFYTDDMQENIKAATALAIDAEQFTTAERLRTHLHERNIL